MQASFIYDCTASFVFPCVLTASRYTGKERDAESNLDMFGARYYSSSLGRFMTPDWAAGPNPVPYANFGDPQSLNLYGYVRNNPLAKADLDGHGWWEKLKNEFGWAQCWCEGKQAETLAKQHKAAREEYDRKWREAANTPEGRRYMAFVGIYAAAYGGTAGGAALTAEAEGGALANANYAQRTYSQTFSDAGAFAGKTVEEVAAALRSGELKASDVSIQYVVKDGNTLILNTRSAQALEQAGIPRSQWNAVNVTGDAAAEARLAGQLQRNNLPSQGTPTVTPEK